MLHDILDDDHLQWHLHWSGITPIFDPITDLDLITKFDFYLIARGFHRTFATDAYSSGHLVLSHFETCKCSYVETNLSWTCLRTFEFRASLGTSVFADNILWLSTETDYCKTFKCGAKI